MINLHSLYAYICVCQFFVVSLRRLSNGKPFLVSGQPFQVPSQKFTIFKIQSQFSSQPFSGLVILLIPYLSRKWFCLSLSCLTVISRYKEFLFHMRSNDYYYISPNLARRTDASECPPEILGAAISLLGRWRLFPNGHSYALPLF